MSVYETFRLEYPKEIQSSALRSELRIKVDVPGEIEYQDLTDSRTIAQVQLVNLSLSGARISCEEFISVGQQLQLLFTVQSDDVERKVEVETIVRSADRKPASPAHDRDTYSYGLQFQNLNTQDQIAIRLLTYETLLTNRQNIA
jgi:c-di-GMP-binding flagellar brake protein YcgR